MDADKLPRAEPLEYLTHRLTQDMPATRGVHHHVRPIGLDPADILHVHRSTTEPAAEKDALGARAVERFANPVERRAKSRLRHGFHDVITRSDIERPRRKLGVRGDENDVSYEGANDILYLESIYVRHADVEKHDVRPNLAHSRGNVARVSTFADD